MTKKLLILYKIFEFVLTRVQITFEFKAERVIQSETIGNKGWTYNKSMEVSHSYGIIRPVDLDLTKEQIFAMITFDEPGQLLPVPSLNRRGYEEKDTWSP